ncbi:hypothetical protein [Nostoc favosum]|uniref:Uncharacterized protein n=1 Tax=Nostoc favosum CHAB5714 TaxID=2780399 RepID=A0ABS8I379_9NOSO|nr:hypothetical protein [Nostoc favosum]MCC5598049.1 hypothetical protein [Nostoc favosum CHAB5714]
MLKANRISIVLAAAALIIVPTLLTAPASAQTKVYVVGDRNRLPNGDILLPNQEIVPAGRLVRVRLLQTS